MKKLFGIFSVLILSTFMLQAQEVTVEQLITNYLENIGGEEAWKEVKSLKMTGSVATQMGAFDAEIIGMRPNLTKIKVSVQGMDLIPQAFDGETAWMINPFSGNTDATKLPAEAAEEMKKQPFEDEFIDYKSKGSTVELLGMKEIEGTETYEVKLVNKDEVEKFYYFDTENFVPIMQKQTMDSGEMKGMTIETYLSDYAEVGNLMIAHSLEQKTDGQSISEITMDKIEINPEGLDKTAFMMPVAEKEEEKEDKN